MLEVQINLLKILQSVSIKLLPSVVNAINVGVEIERTARKLNLEQKFNEEFEDVTIIEYPNNKQRRGDFENVMTLVDAYNMTQSLSLDYLMEFNDDKGGAEWLIKKSQRRLHRKFKKTLQRRIELISGIKIKVIYGSWRRRAKKFEEEWYKRCQQTVEKDLSKYYQKALGAIQEDILKLYGTFAKDNGLDFDEAKKLLQGREFKQWRMSMQEYMQKNFIQKQCRNLINLDVMLIKV